MQGRGTRLTLFVVLVAIGVGAGLLTWDAHRRSADLIATEQDGAAGIDRMLASVAGMGAAQQAYVAPGQPDGPWLEQVSSFIQALSDEAAAFRPRIRSTDAGAALQEVSERIGGLVEIDSRVREHLRLAQELLAADLIFSEGREALDAIAARLRAVGDAQRASFDEERAALARQSWGVLGAAALLWTMGLAWLVRLPAAKQANIVPRVPAAVDAVAAVEAQPVSAAEPEPSPGATAPPALDVAAAADLCTAISRMTTAVQLPDLLARAAVVLDASGLIVWMSAGEELFAVTAHGYDARVISRLGPIGRNVDNATAACWRTGEIKGVPGDMLSNGAIVAPMFSPESCIGVLAIEVRNGREDDASTRAVAVMIAAQLATAVSAWPAASAAPPTAATGS